MEHGDEKQAYVEFCYRDKVKTRAFYKALGGEAALSESACRGRSGFLFRMAGVVTLRLVEWREGDDPNPKHGALLIRNLIPVIARLKERRLDGALGRDGVLRDPFGNTFSAGHLSDPIFCQDVKRTARFYELLGAWMIGRNEGEPGLLVCGSSLVPFVAGCETDRSWSITVHVAAATASAVDGLNKAGFGPFNILTSELKDPDGRPVQLVPAF